ncbi:hypothetical protein BDM02DRAFT_3113783 [Thelephora ganbajun]|uniref:Uncharacterized protein n=1 Tax=Thelephora ganbajun TaxID=370292 RepID=A0ACB6ZHW7_THEGA|nr:hypothetical protein BDM02DRAFT_3113783 [Thelephora ganbajun]
MWYFTDKPATSLQGRRIEIRMECTMRKPQRRDEGHHRAASTNKKRRGSLFHPIALSNLTHWGVSGHRCVIIVHESLGRPLPS